MNSVIDVTDFVDYAGYSRSADNTGMTDVTSIIQVAVDTAYNIARLHTISAAVYFPAGYYLFNGHLYNPGSPNTPFTTVLVPSPYVPGHPVSDYYKNRITIFGDGPSATILQWNPPDLTQHLFDVSGMGVNFYSLTIQSGYTVNADFVTNNSKDSMLYPVPPNIAPIPYNAGAAIHLTGTGNYNLSDLVIYGVYTGIHVVSTSTDVLGNIILSGQIRITKINISNFFIYGILFEKTGGNILIDQCEITNTSNDITSYVSSVGIRINQGDGYQVSNCIIATCGKNCLLVLPLQGNLILQDHPSPPSPPPPPFYIAADNLFFSNTQFDVSQFAQAVRVDGSLVSKTANAYLAFIYFNNCSGTSSATYGFYFMNCIRVTLSNCAAFANGQHGIYVDSTVSHLNINGGQFFQNSLSLSPNFINVNEFMYDGIYIAAGTCDFQILGVDCSGAGVAGSLPTPFTNSQRFGITVGSGQNNDSTGSSSSDRYIIANCNVSGYQYTYLNDLTPAEPSATQLVPIESDPPGSSVNNTYGVNDRGAGVQKKIYGNIGYNPLLNYQALYGPAVTNGTTTTPAPAFQFANVTPPFPLPPPFVSSIIFNPFGIDAMVFLFDRGSLVQNVSVGTLLSQNPNSVNSPNYDPGFLSGYPLTSPFKVPAGASVQITFHQDASPSFSPAPYWVWILD